MAVRFTSSGQQYNDTIAIAAELPFTIACWMKISTDRNARSTVWSLDHGSSEFTRLATDSDGTTMGMFSGGESSIDGTRVLTVGTWYFVAVAHNGTTGTVYYRSLTETSWTTAAWSWQLSGTAITGFSIGADNSGFEELNGAVQGLRWWSAVLTQAELDLEYGQQKPARTLSMRSWYPLLRTETTDYSGNGNTLSGGTGAATEDGPGVRWRQGRRRIVIPQAISVEVLPTVIAATTSIPTPGISIGVNVSPALIAATTLIPTPDIFTGGAVTPVNPGVIAATASIPTPAVDTVKNVSLTPPAIAAVALIPTPTVFVPINPGDDLDGHGQLSYNGFRLGTDTYRLTRLLGTPWDMAAIDNGDVPHPSAHGALAGQKLSELRLVTAELQIHCPHDTVAAEVAVQAFMAGFPVPDADEQLPIAIQIYDTIYVGFGACINRAAPLEQLAILGYIPASVQFAMADPRFYSRELLSATVTDGADVDVSNAGNTSTGPLIRIAGPANQPLVEITRMLPDGTEDVRVLEYDLEVPTGQSLVIDVKLGTVSLNGVSQAQARTNNSVSIPDMVLGKGISSIGYESSEPGAPPAVVLWKNAYL